MAKINLFDKIGKMTENEAIDFVATHERIIWFCDWSELSVNHTRFDTWLNIAEDYAEQLVNDINKELTINYS